MSLIVHCRHSGRHTTAQSSTRYLRALSLISCSVNHILSQTNIFISQENDVLGCVVRIKLHILGGRYMKIWIWVWLDDDMTLMHHKRQRADRGWKRSIWFVRSTMWPRAQRNRTEQNSAEHSTHMMRISNHMHNGTLGRMANVAPHLRHMWW